ncbi:GAF domain-containing protein [Lentibacter sp. XHP0401]|jgi:GAF domain-containing protein|uniref:GAF domain-containing protein n=1 Tax=Lentibacter sp. XHP0401 TaxID=2984334 RepID=UPI0021E924F0|nr:GAF domain-containing protein [Lentibacter sp. XHP0401]MCV2892626.1 GAF domain-containing protein [Lentibacter sp. XHP0401]
MSQSDATAEFDAALATAVRPEQAYDALQRLVERTIGARLFTVMDVVQDEMKGRRAFTSDPVSYPASGWITLRENNWFDTVIRHHKTYVANDIVQITRDFADHALIESLGCRSIVNHPVLMSGTLVATINMLHEEGHFTPERVSTIAKVLNPRALAAYEHYQNLKANRE